MTSAATLAEALAPLRADPSRTAVLFDVDGTLAPIVRHNDDATVPEPTRQLLIAVSKRYARVACVSGRLAADARRVVSIGSIDYLGAHGAELLRAGATAPVVDPAVSAWGERVRDFARNAIDGELRRRRVRTEDKGAIAAFHWRGAPDEEAARSALEAVARSAEDAGLTTHWGRKVLEVRPPVQIDKGVGIVALIGDAPDVDAIGYFGDDRTDLDAFHGLDELVARDAVATALRIAVRSDEGPSELADAADVIVDGTAGVRAALEALQA